MSNYPDNFNGKACDSRFGDATQEQLEADRVATAKDGLKDFLAAQIATYNKLHHLQVSDRVLNHAVECIGDVIGDMYADYSGHVPKPASAIVWESIAKTTDDYVKSLAGQNHAAKQEAKQGNDSLTPGEMFLEELNAGTAADFKAQGVI